MLAVLFFSYICNQDKNVQQEQVDAMGLGTFETLAILDKWHTFD